MSRTVTTPSVKPHLEPLEGRDLPSFLLGGPVAFPLAPPPGGTAPLLTPLKNTITDMQNTQTDLQTQFNFLVSRSTLATPIPINDATQLGQVGQALRRATADWQRMLNDKASVDALSTADQAFINQAALAEFFFEKDATDLIILVFSPLFGDFRAPFNDVKTQADNIIAGTTVQDQVTTSFSFRFTSGGGFVDTVTFGMIRAQTDLPTF
jgi:hypothetical protein